MHVLPDGVPCLMITTTIPTSIIHNLLLSLLRLGDSEAWKQDPFCDEHKVNLKITSNIFEFHLEFSIYYYILFRREMRNFYRAQ